MKQQRLRDVPVFISSLPTMLKFAITSSHHAGGEPTDRTCDKMACRDCDLVGVH